MENLEVLVQEAESIKDADWPAIIAFSQTHVITDAKSLGEANEFLIQLKKLEKETTANEKSFTAGLKDTIKKIEGIFSPKFSNIKSAVAKISEKILAFKMEQERLAREEEKRRAAALEKQRQEELKRMEEEAALNNSLASMFDEEPEVVEQKQVQQQAAIEVLKEQPIIVPVAKTGLTRSKSGSTSVVKRWTYEVVDMQTLADARLDLVMENSVAINNAIRNGEREIPGLRIYQKETLSVR